ncbi:MAG: protein kinase [Nanoarchaeota archaeon]|nr:protein kinase [Nanoarchaeota archaeon]MBU1321595.1 protein kinase [Nanoarchaeota archaeon]MBU1598011.1 protein kinase [Nanoarchaeota archaeon]MBU2440961.1 protein kinase [Nanoarchaeota archaeon]
MVKKRFSIAKIVKAPVKATGKVASSVGKPFDYMFKSLTKPITLTLESGKNIYLKKREVKNQPGVNFVHYFGFDDKDMSKKPPYFVLATLMHKLSSFEESSLCKLIGQEQKTLLTLNHKGIEKAFGPVVKSEWDLRGKFNQRAYFVFEYLDCCSLKSIYNSEDNMLLKNKLKIIQELSEVVDYLHTPTLNKPIVYHRNLNPDNIVLQKNKRQTVKLVNFKDAVFLEPGTSANDQIENSFNELTTYEYLAPERVPKKRGKEWMNAKSEIYSLGIICYELLARFHPFDNYYVLNSDFFDNILRSIGEKYIFLIRGKSNDHYKPLKMRKDAHIYPSGLIEVIEASLEHNWKNRPTAEEFLTNVNW